MAGALLCSEGCNRDRPEVLPVIASDTDYSKGSEADGIDDDDDDDDDEWIMIDDG